jgi:D-lactate dehydrogenase (cytochrome)
MLGLEVVLADGRILQLLQKLKKDNTGYNLRHIFVGAEGTLGVITAAVLKLFPRPRAVETAFVGVPSPAAALKLLHLAQARADGTVTSFELIVREIVEFAIHHGHGVRDPLAGKHPWYVLMEVSSQYSDGLRESLEHLLAAAIEQGIVIDATIAASLEQTKAFWHLRHVLPEIQKPEGGSIKHDVSVPVKAIPDFLARGTALVAKLVPGVRPVPFGHIGDGNIHFNFSVPKGGSDAEFLARWNEITRAVHDLVDEFGGSISAEHGIGVMKREDIVRYKSAAEIDLMRTLKRTLDPNNILNPGKVV